MHTYGETRAELVWRPSRARVRPSLCSAPQRNLEGEVCWLVRLPAAMSAIRAAFQRTSDSELAYQKAGPEMRHPDGATAYPVQRRGHAHQVCVTWMACSAEVAQPHRFAENHALALATRPALRRKHTPASSPLYSRQSQRDVRTLEGVAAHLPRAAGLQGLSAEGAGGSSGCPACPERPLRDRARVRAPGVQSSRGRSSSRGERRSKGEDEASGARLRYVPNLEATHAPSSTCRVGRRSRRGCRGRAVRLRRRARAAAAGCANTPTPRRARSRSDGVMCTPSKRHSQPAVRTSAVS